MMAETKATNATFNRDAMSKALGAAFLNHRVEQLEQTVKTAPAPGGADRRERDRRPSPVDSGARGRGGARRGGNAASAGGGHLIRPRSGAGRPRSGEVDGRPSKEQERGSDGEERARGVETKDADIVIVDASVLVHALGQLKVWCRHKREEIIVIPLEALNTLDLLKKGTNILAQRARAASRILEQQVGTNARIKVQRDDAFVLWDEIPFIKEEAKEADPAEEAAPAPTPISDMKNTPTPEWLRRTICCARWELEHAPEKPEGESVQTGEEAALPLPPKVVVAVCQSSFEAAQAAEAATTAPIAPPPVPLPAPQPIKYEQRCAGTLVAQWAQASGLPTLEIKPTALSAPFAGNAGRPRPAPTTRHARTSSSEDVDWRGGSPGKGAGAPARRVFHPNTSRAKPSPPQDGVYGPGRSAGSGAMVERPAATMAMNASVVQPGKVIRVLARGEKLEP